MGAGASRPTTKLDPQDLLGLLALTEGKERLRPTCEMPKLELASLLDDPAMGRSAPQATLPELPEPSPEPEPILAKGSSGISPIPREVLIAARDPITRIVRPEVALLLTWCVLAILVIAGIMSL